MAFGWHYLILAGTIVLVISAYILAPADLKQSVRFSGNGGTAPVSLPSLFIGAGFTTVSWSNPSASTEVQLFYCAVATCPLVNESQLMTGRTAWTEFYGDSGASGSLADYWNNENPLTATRLLVAAENFAGTLTVQVSTVYHTPLGTPYPSGWVELELAGTILGSTLIGFGVWQKVRR